MKKDLAPRVAQGPPVGLLGAHVDAFVARLFDLGYAPLTVRIRRQIAVSFARWTRRRQLAVAHLDESHVAAFIREAPRRSRSREGARRSALRLLLEHLRAEGEISTPPPPSDESPSAVLQERYERHLRRERGLAEKSIRVYRPFVRDFLVERAGASDRAVAAALGPQDVRDFLLDRVGKRPTKSPKILGTALRSFLRYLFLRGETTVDLSLAVPTIRRWRLANVHPYISPDEVERVLRACDLATPVGRRNHAVLLLLARLGLRAGEVLALELGDIRWRTGELLVRGKGQVFERLPLLPDVGEALVVYLREDRPGTACRRVFLRMRAPRVSFTSPSAIGSIVRCALARAGLQPPLRGAHLLRHSLATSMIRRGASMAEISEVLRHRSPDTTEIYAKVDFEALRTVALPWPGAGGGR
jgi:site-specific recombinase XerD